MFDREGGMTSVNGTQQPEVMQYSRLPMLLTVMPCLPSISRMQGRIRVKGRCALQR